MYPQQIWLISRRSATIKLCRNYYFFLSGKNCGNFKSIM